MRKNRIEAQLLAFLSPLSLKVEDVSSLHKGHGGHTGEGETHFKVTIISDAFQGMRRIQRHQQVYECLREEFKGGLHALQVITLCPVEALEVAEDS